MLNKPAITYTDAKQAPGTSHHICDQQRRRKDNFNLWYASIQALALNSHAPEPS